MEDVIVANAADIAFVKKTMLCFLANMFFLFLLARVVYKKEIYFFGLKGKVLDSFITSIWCFNLGLVIAVPANVGVSVLCLAVLESVAILVYAKNIEGKKK